MIQLTFKNVGQGDSIILEWVENDLAKICIIDCNLVNGDNPILDYIISNGYKTIDYLILSHPHFDHFSGFLQLLEYCKSNSIKVKYFLHTCSQVPTFLISASKSAVTKRELQRLFAFLFKNFKDMNMKVAPIQGDTPNSEFLLNEDFSLKILSPTITESNNYVRNSIYPFHDEESQDNPKANLLSTILKLECDKWYVLLTSDADKSSLIRIDRQRSEELDKILTLGQIPHHGAFGNHNNTFWKKRKRFNRTAMIVSAGVNSYDHPSPKVIDFFLENSFVLYSTSDTSNYPRDLIETLDVFSYSDPDYNSTRIGDQTFIFNSKDLDYKHQT